MLNATKLRIYPNGGQKDKLAQQFGCVRYVFNRALGLKKEAWDSEQRNISCYEIKKQLPNWKRQLPWLQEADSQALQQSVLNLDKAYKAFFTKRARFPRFKSRRAKQSIQYPQRVKLDENLLYLPKVGWVKAKVHRSFEGRIKTVTVSKAATGKYYASILTDDGIEEPLAVTHIERIVGVDLGLTDLIVASDGQREGNPHIFKKHKKNLRRKQKALSRKKKDSANRAKAKLLVAKAHERVKDARQDFQHKVTRRLTDENQAVAVEDLAVKNMVKLRPLAKAISDAGWHSIRQKLDYKLKRSGGHLVVIDRFFASSKQCSSCGRTNRELKLCQRKWVCPTCNALLDRDLNAAVNIKDEGIVKLRAEGLSVSAHGGQRKTRQVLAAAREVGSLRL